MLSTTTDVRAPAEFVADKREAWRIFIALLFGTFVAIEASAFQSPALSSIARHFEISPTTAALILLLYYLGSAVFAPVMGGLGDRIGRKRMILIGLAVFSASEFLAAVSPTYVVFLGARFLQGIGVACIMPVVLAVVGQLFSPEERGRPLGLMSFSMALGAITGALLAGFLIDGYGWPSIYWVSGTLALLGIVLVAMLVPDMPPLQRRAFDIRGTLLLFLMLSGLLSLPTVAGIHGATSVFALGALALGILGAVLLWFSSEKTVSPVIETSLLRKRAYALPTLIYLLHTVCYGGALYSLAFIIAERPGGSASQVGFVNLFIYSGAAVGALWFGRLIDRIDPRKALLGAMFVTFVGLILFAQIRAETPLAVVIAIVGVLGVVSGGKAPTAMKIALGSIPENKLGAGAGLLTMMRDIGIPAGSSFGLAIYGATVGNRMTVEVLQQAQSIGLADAWTPALMKAIESRGRNVDAALVDELAGRGLTFSELASSVTANAISTAMPTLGYSLAAVMFVAIVLAVVVLRR